MERTIITFELQEAGAYSVGNKSSIHVAAAGRNTRRFRLWMELKKVQQM